MSGINLNSSAVNTQAYVKDAQKNYTKDRSVDLTQTDTNVLKKDLQGAVDTAKNLGQKEIFLAHKVGDKMVTEKVDLSDPNNKASIDKLINQIGPNFQLSSGLKFTPRSQSSSSTISSTPNVKVSNNEVKANKDAGEGKDEQFKVLSQNSENFIDYDQKTGTVKGLQTVKEDSNYDKSTGKYSVSASDKTESMPTKMQDVIKNDFNQYSKSLGDKFPINQDGSIPDETVKKFMESLKRIPENATNPNINETNAKQLLSYVHKGENLSGNVNVKELQNLLKNMTGSKGEEISGTNNDKGGDNRYGFATTMQVRSLAAQLNEGIFSGNPVILIDHSQSMSTKIEQVKSELRTRITASTEGEFHVADFGSTSNSKDFEWKTDGDNNKNNGVNAGVDGKTAIAAINGIKTTNQEYESGIKAGLYALENLPKLPEGKKENMLIFTDEGDLGANGLKDLLAKAKEKGYKPILIFNGSGNATENPKSKGSFEVSGPKMFYAIDLEKFQEQAKSKNADPAKAYTGKYSEKGSASGDKYDIMWERVIQDMKLTGSQHLKDLSLPE